jgi:hypothetical protein
VSARGGTVCNKRFRTLIPRGAHKLDKATRDHRSQLLEEINDELFDEYLKSEVTAAPRLRTIAKAVQYLRIPKCPAMLT